MEQRFATGHTDPWKVGDDRWSVCSALTLPMHHRLRLLEEEKISSKMHLNKTRTTIATAICLMNMNVNFGDAYFIKVAAV